jgi:hypothetical protein
MTKIYVDTQGEWHGTLDFIEDGVSRRILDNREQCAYNLAEGSPLGKGCNEVKLTVGGLLLRVKVENEPPKKGLLRRVKDALSVLFS